MPAALDFIFEPYVLRASPHLLPFPPPAIFLHCCSHTGLGLNEKCIVSFIHSSQRVIELICLASVCWGAAEIRASVGRDGITALKDGIKMSLCL